MNLERSDIMVKDWREDIEFDMELDCPENKEAYDNECYDCDWYICCLGRYEQIHGR